MYKLTASSSIIRKSDGAIIPADPANVDYAEFIRWQADNNTPEPADVPDHAQLVAATISKAKQMRMPILQVLDGMQSSALTLGTTVMWGDPPQSTALALVIEELKTGIKALPDVVDLSQCATQQEMEASMLAAYYQLAQSAPQSVQSAFNSLVP